VYEAAPDARRHAGKTVLVPFLSPHPKKATNVPRLAVIQTLHFIQEQFFRIDRTNELGAESMVTGSRPRDFRIQEVVQVLNDDPCRTLPELARSCQISMSRLSHLFKDEIGVNVKDYRLDCRLQVAAALLVSTRMLVKQIAYSAGYCHTSSFVRAFKSHFGLSPTCYRQRRSSIR
jgi:transcriptional regulator GlxA family with amidase domain